MNCASGRDVYQSVGIDTVSATLRLPEAKLNKLQREVAERAQKRSCTRKELESFIGTLQFACRVIPAGQSFLRHMIASLSQAKAPHHHIRLNRHFRGDLAWWAAFARQWNGVALLLEIEEAPPVCLATDASGGLWGLVRVTLVPVAVAKGAYGEKYCHQGTCANSNSSGHLGAEVGKEAGTVSL